MGIEEFVDFMPASITITPYLSVDVGGLYKYNTVNAYSLMSRIQMKNHIVTNRGGREVVAKGTIYLDAVIPPDIKDQITLPMPFSPTNPTLIDVIPEYDENGIHHIKLEIG